MSLILDTQILIWALENNSRLSDTLAMVRTFDPHSDRSQFFVNLNDNDFLNFGIAGNTRKALKEKVPKKPYKIVDVNQSEVERVKKEAGIHQLIQGHTDRAVFHEFEINELKAKRIVLNDWIAEACYLSIDVSEGLK